MCSARRDADNRRLDLGRRLEVVAPDLCWRCICHHFDHRQLSYFLDFSYFLDLGKVVGDLHLEEVLYFGEQVGVCRETAVELVARLGAEP